MGSDNLFAPIFRNAATWYRDRRGRTVSRPLARGFRPSLSWALVVGAVLRVFLAHAIPTGFEERRRGVSWYNDELAHANYVRHLVETREFPGATGSVRSPGAFARGDFEYYQPPLAYVAMAPLWWVGDRIGSGWLFARLLNGLLGIATIAVAWKYVAQAHSPKWADWTAWFLATLPSFCYQGTLVSNDAAFWLLSASFLLVAARMERKASAWLLAPLTACLLLTKSSALPLLPLPLLAVAMSSGEDRRARKAIRICLLLAAGCLLAFPWYLRNLHLYGSWLALESGHGATFPVWQTISSAAVLKMLALANLASMWFPMDATWAAGPVPRLFFAVASLAWTAPMAASILTGRIFRSQTASAARGVLLSPARSVPGVPMRALSAGAILLSLAAFVPYALRYQQSDARLLFHLFPAYFALWTSKATRCAGLWGILHIAPPILVWFWIGWRYLAMS